MLQGLMDKINGAESNSDDLYSELNKRADELGIKKTVDQLNDLLSSCGMESVKINLSYKSIEKKELLEFNSQLIKKTFKLKNGTFSYTCIEVVDIKKYTEVPPMSCLIDLKKARESKEFDQFLVVYPVIVQEKMPEPERAPDPIIFGLKRKSDRLFFITQWDNDLTFSDIEKMSQNKDE